MVEEKENKKQDEIVSEWISDVNVRIEAGKRFGNKKNEETKRYIMTMENK